MKRMLLILFYFLLGLVGFALLFFIAEAVLSRISAHRPVKENYSERTIPIYLLSNGVHMDLVFPIKSDYIDWSELFPFKNTIGQDRTKNWIAIGWGDKGFYLNTPEWKDLSLKTALVAGLGIGETALHVTYYRFLTEDELCYKEYITADQYQILIDYVLNSLELGTDGKPIYIETTAQYGEDDAFYEALGSYSLFYSCNTWTNNALKSAKLPSAVWTVFDKGILRHYPKD